MTSPEWEAANEDDSDRFPQTSHASAPESTESHERGSRVVPDPERVARYAEVLRKTDDVTLEETNFGQLSATYVDAARAVVAVADEECAALVGEVERMRERLTSERSDVEGLLRVAAEHAAEVVSGELGPRYLDERLRADREEARAEAAEAEVERLRGVASDHERWRSLWEERCIRAVDRAEAAEAKVAKVEALLTPDTTWRCSDCGWVADEQTIEQALWREAERTVSMVCPECSAEGSFVDHEPLVEDVSDLVHAAWMDTKREQGVTSRLSEWGEEQMVPYAELSERAKDLDRGTVRAVLAAVRAVLADAPAEQRDEGGA